jgi:hypothetical protein
MRRRFAIYKESVFPEIKDRTVMVRKYFTKNTYERKDMWLIYRNGVWYLCSEETLKFL